MIQPLTIERFRALLAAYGAHPERWPDDERERAMALVASSPEAERSLAAETSFDAAVAALEPEEPSADLMRRLNEIPARFPAEHAASRRFGLLAALGWAMAAAFGVIWGVRSADTEAFSADTGMSAAAAGQSTDATSTAAEQDDDIVALALGSVGDIGDEQ